jgi:hypothetical protein
MRLDEDLKELRNRINGLSDDELLDIVEVEAADYREEAVEFAKAALLARGIEPGEGSAAEEDVEAEEEEYIEAEEGTDRGSLLIADPKSLPVCTLCGGKTQLGILFAKNELTFLFPYEKREGAVNAFACRRCGSIQLFLDPRTDVLREEEGG